MQAQVKEWGNSQGIRLSKEVLKSAGIKLNEFLDVEVSTSKNSFNLIPALFNTSLDKRIP